MVLKLTPQLAAALAEQAQKRGVAAEVLALEALQDRFLSASAGIARSMVSATQVVEPIDDWERKLFGAAINCGVSVPDTALSSDSLYD